MVHIWDKETLRLTKKYFQLLQDKIATWSSFVCERTKRLLPLPLLPHIRLTLYLQLTNPLLRHCEPQRQTSSYLTRQITRKVLFLFAVRSILQRSRWPKKYYIAEGYHNIKSKYIWGAAGNVNYFEVSNYISLLVPTKNHSNKLWTVWIDSPIRSDS